MKNSSFFICMLLVWICSCSQQGTQSDLMSFDNNPRIKKGHLSSLELNGWFVSNGNASIDSVELFNDRKSLKLQNDPADSLKISQVYYYANTRDITGDSIYFSGKFKYKGADSTSIVFGIQQMGQDTMANAMTEIGKRSGDSEWNDFTIKTAMSSLTSGINFFVFTTGNIELWTSNWQAQLDKKPLGAFVNHEFSVEKDKEFDYGSSICLSAPTTQTYENLEVLGKVWGVLKYYHPEVTQGNYNWDYELFRILPQIAKAPDKDKRNKLLNEWIDKYGKITQTVSYAIEDSSKYSRIIDTDWINDENLFDAPLISKLNTIKNAKRNLKFNYYLIPYQSGGSSLFDREKEYPLIPWKDQGYRILTLYRLWNAVEYCFPYTEMTDKPWDTLLGKFLPRFVSPVDNEEYKLAILELLTCINDSHGFVYIPREDLEKTILKRQSDSFVVPVTLIESKSGDIVVRDTRTFELERGDIIRTIDGEDVKKIITDLSPYVPASNHPTLVRNVLPRLLRTDTGYMNITCIRNGKEIQIDIKNFGQNRRRQPHELSDMKWPKDYNLSAKKIIYIDVSMAESDAITDMIQNNKNAKGMILDMRKYPSMAAYGTLPNLLLPAPQEFMWFSFNRNEAPGNYKLCSIAKAGSDNPDYFKGKVAILVNEGTQSHGEFSSMAYRKAPQSAIIGSTTAGADGNIGSFYLPGKATCIYTALGAYYPNWEQCQRKGVKIDIEVRPTNQEIRNGQDVWIEKAIEYILK